MDYSSRYIDEDKIDKILADLNIEGLSDDQVQNILDRAEGDLETELCERFVVPLISENGDPFFKAPKFAQQKVLNAIYAKIRSIIGKDKDRNIVVDATQRYIDVHEQDFKQHIKTLLDSKKKFGFKLNTFSEGSYEPTQSIGLARANNDIVVEPDPDIPLF